MLPDGHDEGIETMALVLSTASGAAISEIEGVGTIVNEGPIPKAWIGRFGRTVRGAVHVAAALAVGAALVGSVLRFNAMQLMGAVGVGIAAGAGTGIVTGLVGTAIV